MKKVLTLSDLKNVLTESQIISASQSNNLKGGDEGTVVDPYILLKK